MSERTWRPPGGRKFWTLILATVLLWFGKVTPEVWGFVAAVYIGLNVAQKAVEFRVGKG